VEKRKKRTMNRTGWKGGEFVIVRHHGKFTATVKTQLEFEAVNGVPRRNPSDFGGLGASGISC